MECKKDVDELKKTLDFISSQLEDLKEGQREQKQISDKFIKQVTLLEEQNIKKTKQISALEQRINDLEQYSRNSNVLITGLSVPQSYAATAAVQKRTSGPRLRPRLNTEGDAGVNELNLEDVVLDLFNNKMAIKLDPDDLENVHLLPSRNKPLLVIVRFVSRKKKYEVMKAKSTLKGKNIYINDHLTRLNAEVFKKTRELKKQNKLEATWTRNGKVFIKRTNGKIAEVANISDIFDKV